MYIYIYIYIYGLQFQFGSYNYSITCFQKQLIKYYLQIYNNRQLCIIKYI